MKVTQGTILTTCLVVTLVGTPVVFGDGRLTYGDKCSVPSAILRVFTNQDINENEKCNSDQGLICTGTCTCPPTRVWDKGLFFGLFGGSSCIVGANGPCAKGDKCVSNAVCGDNIPLCFCMEGYYAHELQCISSYGHKSLPSKGPSLLTSSLTSLISAVIFANVIFFRLFKL